MLSISEYAKKANVSYEAIRTQIKRYSGDLKGHIHKQGRKQFLDDYAVEFLDGKRRNNPVIVVTHAKDDEIQMLKEENERLKNALLDAQNQLLKAKEQEIKVIEAKSQIGILEAKLEASDKEVEALKAETTSYHKTIFGLYRKK